MGNGHGSNYRANNVMNRNINPYSQQLSVLEQKYDSNEQTAKSLQQKGDNYNAQSASLSASIDDTTIYENAQSVILHNEENLLDISKLKIDNENNYTDLAQKQMIRLSGENIQTEQNTEEIMLNMYENIRDQNKQLYETVNKLNNMFSTDQSKTLYLKGKTSSWDFLMSVLFVIYYIMFIVLIFELFSIQKSMHFNMKVLYMLFFLMLPTFVGFFTSFVAGYFPREFE